MIQFAPNNSLQRTHQSCAAELWTLGVMARFTDGWEKEMLIENVTAILLISPDAKKLSDFYKNTLALPMEDEVHENIPLHYACELDGLHFAIHPADGWPGVPTQNAQSPVIAFSTSDANEIARSSSRLHSTSRFSRSQRY